MSSSSIAWHGRIGKSGWATPGLAVECADANRADQGNTTRV